MTKHSDKQLQELIEKGQVDLNNPDSRLYKSVFDALSSEPESSLKSGFAENVALKAGFGKASIFSLKDWGFLACLILGSFIISLLTFFFYNTLPEFSFLSFFWEFRWYLLFGIVLIGGIQLADKLLVHKKQIFP